MRNRIPDPKSQLIAGKNLRVARFRSSSFGNRTIGTWICLCGLLVLPAAAADPPQYNRDIRPILSQNCFKCHGPDSASRKAELRLDQRESAVQSGAITPGNLDQSEILRRIVSSNAEEKMPPPASGKVLTQAEIETLRSWILSGAEYQPHWSFIAPTRPPLPAVNNTQWVRNPLDQFILARLESLNLAPAAEADRHTLARRASLDITGLPPEPALLAEFVNDTAPDAYEKYVDRLLESPRYGEHRARYWLDVARYADTHGIHFDNYREIWAYRDWVIDAYNRNMPFDQFTIEQLAGDLLPNPTLDQKIATGFNRCNITTNEGGVIPEEYLVLYTRDRTETTSQVWLGLTANCAVCHDHKFDPLTQREFYSMAAFFNNTRQGAMDGNIKDTPPVIPVPTRTDRARFEQIAGELSAAQKRVDDRKQSARADFDKWLAAAPAEEFSVQSPVDRIQFHAPLSEGSGESLHVAMNGQVQSIKVPGAAWDTGHVAAQAWKVQPGVVAMPRLGDFEKDQGFSCGAWVKMANPAQGGSFVARMNDQADYRGWDLWLDGGRIGTHLVHKWPVNAVKVRTKKAIEANQWVHALITYDGSGKGSGIKIYLNGQPQEVEIETDSLSDTIRTEVPCKIGQRHTGQSLADLSMQDLRLYTKTLSPEEAQQLVSSARQSWLASKPADQRSDGEKTELLDGWLVTRDAEFKDAFSALVRLQNEEREILARGTIAHVMTEQDTPPKAKILFRGDYDKPRDEVDANTPSFLPPLPGELPRNRLGFAQWLLRPEHPTTTRVTVNRIWQEVFGQGIVKTAGDFGVTGEMPTHPELLDWLAVEFRESGWNVKQFIKMLVTSAAYRQAAVSTPEKVEKDPQNRLLSRGPRFRMDAEMIRDYALSVSGLLRPTVGGPSVRPYQPEGVWEAVAMIGSNTRDYKRDQGESLYRRSMYTFWKRSAPPASMEILNAPSREFCAMRRERTNTPLQSLVTLNDEQFVESARVLAQDVLQQGGSTTLEQLDYVAKRVLARPFREKELPVVQSSLSELLKYYGEHGEQAADLVKVGETPMPSSLDPGSTAAWTMLINELLNLDEVLCK